jgi:hypothetical protein
MPFVPVVVPSISLLVDLAQLLVKVGNHIDDIWGDTEWLVKGDWISFIPLANLLL